MQKLHMIAVKPYFLTLSTMRGPAIPSLHRELMFKARLKGSKMVPPYLTQCQGSLLIESPIPDSKLIFRESLRHLR